MPRSGWRPLPSSKTSGPGSILSMHDLEIRGAGEVLGDNQSGEMQEIGFSLYSEMLNQAVRALKAGREPDLDEPLGVTTEVNLHTPALLPDDYCPGVHERLVIYKRFANCETEDALEDLKEELIDRFGCCRRRPSHCSRHINCASRARRWVSRRSIAHPSAPSSPSSQSPRSSRSN